MRAKTSTKRKREIEAVRQHEGIVHPPEGMEAVRAMLSDAIAAELERKRAELKARKARGG